MPKPRKKYSKEHIENTLVETTIGTYKAIGDLTLEECQQVIAMEIEHTERLLGGLENLKSISRQFGWEV